MVRERLIEFGDRSFVVLHWIDNVGSDPHDSASARGRVLTNCER
jgi:hypothetical protein